MTYTKNIKKKKLCEYNLAFVDSETTGLSPRDHEIIEIAAIIYDPRKDKIIKEWSRKAAPRNIKTANKVALDMNGYNEAPETYKDDIKSVISEYYKLTNDCIVVGQNIQFDINFIKKYYKEFSVGGEFHRHRRLEISSMVWPVIMDSELESISLKALCEHFNVSNENAHRALTDCRRTLEIYRCLMNIYKTSIKHI
jgi:DNA polymerase III alpha subunit (gram-positive type)